MALAGALLGLCVHSQVRGVPHPLSAVWLQWVKQLVGQPFPSSTVLSFMVSYDVEEWFLAGFCCADKNLAVLMGCLISA